MLQMLKYMHNLLHVKWFVNLGFSLSIIYWYLLYSFKISVNLGAVDDKNTQILIENTLDWTHTKSCIQYLSISGGCFLREHKSKENGLTTFATDKKWYLSLIYVYVKQVFELERNQNDETAVQHNIYVTIRFKLIS